MLSPISMDSAFLSLSADLLPDTSGLAPLALPDEFLSGQNAPRQQPSPDAIRRFQSALASDTPSASTPSPLQALSSLSQSATPPPTPEEAPLQALPISTVPVPLEAPPVSTEPPSALPPVAPLSPIPDTPSVQSAPLIPASVLPQSTPTAPSIPSPVSTPSHEQIPAQSLAPALSHPSPSSLQSYSSLSSLPSLPPSPNLAKAAAHLAIILFSRFEAIPPETLQERELRITLPPTILDASTIVLTAQNSSLLVQVIPSNSETIPLAFALLPYLTDALASRLPASMPPQVVLATPESPAAQPATISALPETTPQSVAPATQPQRSQMNPLASSDATPPAIKLADLLPDTSGLPPLTLPPELFSARFQIPPAPEAIRRFQTVLSAPPPAAPESPSSLPLQSLPSLEFPSSLPPSADLTKTTDQLAQILCANLETISPATLEHHEIRIHLPTSLLDASTLVITPKNNTLHIQIVPAKPETIPLASALLPRLVEIVETRLPALPQLQITLAPPATSLPPSTPPLQSLPSLPSLSSLPPASDIAQTTTQLAEVLLPHLETLPPTTLENHEIAIPLPPALLDASTVVVTTKDNTLHVQIVPARPETIPLASALLPRLVEIVETRLPAIPQLQITLAPPATPLLSSTPSLSSLPPATDIAQTAPILPPPADMAKAAADLAELLFSRVETLTPETLKHRELRIPLPSTLLDASTIVITTQDNTLHVQIIPAKPETLPLASALLPRLVEIVENRLPAFPQVQITLAPPATVLPPSTPALQSLPSFSSLPSANDIAQTTPILPPPADMAKAAAALAKLLFSRVENLTPETLEHRELRIPLPPTLLDASTIIVTAQDNTLHVQIIPTNPETIPLASALLPRLMEIVETRLPAFPQVQITLAPPATSLPTSAPSLASLPKTAPVPIPPNEAAQKEKSTAENTSPTLQALPLSAPVPLETPPATTKPPQKPATQPVAPAQNIPSTPKLDDSSTPSTPPRQTNGNSEETPTSAPLQAIPFAAPAPFEASIPAPTPPSAPHAAPAPAAQPAIPAEEPLPREAIQPLRPLTIPAQPTESIISSSIQANAPTHEAAELENAPRKAASPPLQAAPVDIPAAPAAPVPLSDPAPAAQAASARTATIAETANQIASAVAARILVSPSLAQGGDGEIRITLQPSILDGSQVTLTAQSGTLSVTLTPATPDAAQQAAAALPTLAAALEAHAPAFHRVHVALAAKKGTTDETA